MNNIELASITFLSDFTLLSARNKKLHFVQNHEFSLRENFFRYMVEVDYDCVEIYGKTKLLSSLGKNSPNW
jgi:hypothetical protein